MDANDSNIFVTVGVGLGSLVLVAIVLLSVGEWLKRAFPRVFPSPAWAAIHVLALVSALVGAFLAWVASQQPGRPRLLYLLLPLILPGVVYGGIAFFWLKGLLTAGVLLVLARIFRNGRGRSYASTHENRDRDAT